MLLESLFDESFVFFYCHAIRLRHEKNNKSRHFLTQMWDLLLFCRNVIFVIVMEATVFIYETVVLAFFRDQFRFGFYFEISGFDGFDWAELSST